MPIKCKPREYFTCGFKTRKSTKSIDDVVRFPKVPRAGGGLTRVRDYIPFFLDKGLQMR